MTFRAWIAACLAGAVGTVAGVRPSAANWAFTQWEMTPDQVQKASPTELQPPDEVEKRLRSRGGMELLLEGPYKMGPYQFNAFYMFDDDNKLQRVILELQDINLCSQLAADLEKNYRKSNIDRSEGSMTSREYQDEKHANVLGFYAIPRVNVCQLSYSYTLSYEKFGHPG